MASRRKLAATRRFRSTRTRSCKSAAGQEPGEAGRRRAALNAFFVDLQTLASLVNIGTLFAFIVVAAGVVVLRRTRPDLERAYRTPFVPLVPLLAILAALWLMLNLEAATWLRFGVWMALGLVVYFGYSRRHSRVG